MGKANAAQAAVLAKARTQRIGMGGYFKILAFMRRKGRTSEDISKRLRLNHNTTVKVLRFMRQLKLIHRTSWVQLVKNAPLVPVWRLGAAGDVGRPGGELRSDRPPVPWPALITVATVIEVLKEEPRSIADLGEELGVHPYTAAKIVALMRAAGLSRISRYEKLAIGHPVPYHGYLVSADAELPGSQDAAEARKRWKAAFHQKRRHMALLSATAGALPAAEA